MRKALSALSPSPLRARVGVHRRWAVLHRSTVVPMARGGRGGITGNVSGQGFTSPSPFTHVQGDYGAPTGAVGGAVGGAADGRPSMRKTSLVARTPVSVSHAIFCGGRTQYHVTALVLYALGC